MGAAPLELATGDAVMAIGGFNGTDPWPTLAVFKELVAKHEIHYYVGQGSQSFGGGRGSSAIAAWVAAHFTKQTVGGQTVYDLTSRPVGQGVGGLGGNTAVSSALTKLLQQDAASYRWVAATEGSTAAAPLELATGDAVMSHRRVQRDRPAGPPSRCSKSS